MSHDDDGHLAALVPRLFSLGSLALLWGARLTWSDCAGAFCSVHRSVLEDAGLADVGIASAVAAAAIVHLVEVVPALLALGATLWSFALVHQRAPLEGAWRAWRASSALQWAAAPVVGLLVGLQHLNHGLQPNALRAVTANVLLLGLALVDPRRLGVWWWARLVALSGVLMVLLGVGWTWVVRQF